jgi:hypothetical protein
MVDGCGSVVTASYVNCLKRKLVCMLVRCNRLALSCGREAMMPHCCHVDGALM